MHNMCDLFLLRIDSCMTAYLNFAEVLKDFYIYFVIETAFLVLNYRPTAIYIKFSTLMWFLVVNELIRVS